MAKKKQSNSLGKVKMSRHLKKEWQIYSLLLIPVFYFIIFKYIPMLGNIIAFRKYSGGVNIFGEKWVGFRYFRQFMRDHAFWRAFSNTLILSISYLAVRFPLTLIFALLLNEIRNVKWKKFVQTVSYLPHFISMVIIAGMIKEVVSLSGPINTLISSMGGEKVSFIQEAAWFPPIYIISGIWQALGWGTIIYLAAMTGINTELYEAARVDGASRFKQALHVTIPGILPTIVTLLILDIGGIMGSNFEKIILLYLPSTYETADVISTLVYRMGITGGNFSYATAVGLFEGIIGLILVTSANFLSRKVTESSLW
ncbi:putative aldouronate transport system permease protein [Anaerocolumna jejuensis DSM 15929]|uniref:Putative aldouronate transport system permease protein n=1 Tax=Anaerocolumna jejuensis DSM 15929 TaxID=1121322 RepID=A0A1M6JYY2_9FIRM|nr:ABC transporter permease subunit [Anaerocolumna jejuensis]SHJ51886.1 putative aldouronate transport system permease protein [Anaerocolumna jejuensis DSM 15929]